MSKLLYTDLMEYPTDNDAQSAWVSNAGGSGGLPSSEYTSDSYTKLLLHMNGVDGSTTFTDDGNTGHTVTANGNAQIDTAQKKFGTGAGLFDGTGDYLSIPDSADWNFGTGDFTIDWWMKFNVLSGNGYKGGIEQYVDSNNFFQVSTYYYNGKLYLNQFYCKSGGTTIFYYYSTLASGEGITGTIGIDWNHYTVVRNGGNVHVFINGVEQSMTEGTTISGKTFPDISAPFTIGLDTNNGYTFLDGWIDEFRISKGIARWVTDFDVATKDLQCYSEATIKQQGSYSLKIDANTDALNDTLTKTLTDYLDYSIMDVLKFEVRASRTGSNIKLKIHDIDGDTQEHAVNIASANTWQTESWDISGISGTKRDQIDKIIIEITNASVANEIYIDNLFSKAIVETSHTWVG